MANRDSMNRVLRERVVPALRKRGFTGSMPHFRCVMGDSLRLLTFQFRSGGGAFVVELGQCPAGEFTTSYGAIVPQTKMNVTYLSPSSRFRLGASEPLADHWFDFEKNEKGCEICADEVLAYLASDGDRLWNA